MRRFFIDPANIKNSQALITGPEAHHIKKVLRLPPGEKLLLFDGTGTLYHVIIEELTTKEIRTTILHAEEATQQGALLHLGIGLLKSSKMDFAIQKATELGVVTIAPFVSQHCAVHEKKARIERWQRIALEACKQCGRPIPPAIQGVKTFSDLLTRPRKSVRKIIFWEKEQACHLAALKPPLSSQQAVFALIGPEGGFHITEIDQATTAGFLAVTMGERALRAETAVITATSILQFLLGNLQHSE